MLTHRSIPLPARALCGSALLVMIVSSAAEAQSPPKSDAVEQAVSYRKSRKYDEAVQMLEQAIASAPDDATRALGRFELGQTIFARAQAGQKGQIENVDSDGDLRKAAAMFQEVVEKYPTSEKAPDAAYMTGSSYLLLDDLTNALVHYTRTYEGFPKYDGRSRALLRMGVCEAGLDRPQQARAIFQQLMRTTPADSSDRKKASKYLTELSLVGTKPRLHADRWLHGTVGPEGLPAFEGQIVVVIFFATWCNHCADNMPRLRSLIAEWYPKGVVFLGVANPKDPENTMPVDVYVERKKIDFVDVALDGEWRSWASFKVSGLPAAAVIDPEGVVRWRGNLSFLPVPLLERLAR